MLPQDLKQLQTDKDFKDQLIKEAVKCIIVFSFIIALFFC